MSKRMVDLKVEAGKVASIDDYEVGGGTAVEANPQEEATQQLEKIKIDNIAYNIASGGSSGSGFVVKNISTSITKADRTDNIGWVSGRELKANTSYEVGDQVQIKYNQFVGSYSIQENNICVPIVVEKQAGYSNQKLQFGDVILVCTNAGSSITTNKNGQTFDFSIFTNLTYTIIKAGTTGSDVSIPAGIASETELSLNFYSLGPATA